MQLPSDPNLNPAMVPGWWLGLEMMETLFTLEHNAICDRLRAEYPNWSDDDIFERARLINAALIAKIHTVEWTPAIISHPTSQVALKANWWGIQMELLNRVFGRLSANEVISGIPGSETDHFGVPYCLTEEFTIVYRMHSLIPDEYSFRTEMQQRMKGTVWTSECASWYLDASSHNTTLWPGFTFEFRRRTRHFDPQHYNLTPQQAPAHEYSHQP